MATVQKQAPQRDITLKGSCEVVTEYLCKPICYYRFFVIFVIFQSLCCQLYSVPALYLSAGLVPPSQTIWHATVCFRQWKCEGIFDYSRQPNEKFALD